MTFSNGQSSVLLSELQGRSSLTKFGLSLTWWVIQAQPSIPPPTLPPSALFYRKPKGYLCPGSHVDGGFKVGFTLSMHFSVFQSVQQRLSPDWTDGLLCSLHWRLSNALPGPAAEACKGQSEISRPFCQFHDTNPHGGACSPLPWEANISSTSSHQGKSQLLHRPFRMMVREQVFLIHIPQNNVRCVLNHICQPWALQVLMSTEPSSVVMPRGTWFRWSAPSTQKSSDRLSATECCP